MLTAEPQNAFREPAAPLPETGITVYKRQSVCQSRKGQLIKHLGFAHTRREASRRTYRVRARTMMMRGRKLMQKLLADGTLLLVIDD